MYLPYFFNLRYNQIVPVRNEAATRGKNWRRDRIGKIIDSFVPATSCFGKTGNESGKTSEVYSREAEPYAAHIEQGKGWVKTTPITRPSLQSPNGGLGIPSADIHIYLFSISTRFLFYGRRTSLEKSHRRVSAENQLQSGRAENRNRPLNNHLTLECQITMYGAILCDASTWKLDNLIIFAWI